MSCSELNVNSVRGEREGASSPFMSTTVGVQLGYVCDLESEVWRTAHGTLVDDLSSPAEIQR